MGKWMTALWQGLLNGAEAASRKPGLDLERRQTPRCPSNLTVSCRPASLGNDSWLEVRLQDISAGGLGLSSPRAFEPGKLLEVERPGPAGKRPFRLVTCVRHARQEEPGRWRLGCSFIRELDDAELEALQQPLQNKDGCSSETGASIASTQVGSS
jgi:hypothetical protein